MKWNKMRKWKKVTFAITLETFCLKIKINFVERLLWQRIRKYITINQVRLPVASLTYSHQILYQFFLHQLNFSHKLFIKYYFIFTQHIENYDMNVCGGAIKKYEPERKINFRIKILLAEKKNAENSAFYF